jgi:hypothetical protein
MALLLALQDEVADAKARLGISANLVDDLLNDRAKRQHMPKGTELDHTPAQFRRISQLKHDRTMAVLSSQSPKDANGITAHFFGSPDIPVGLFGRGVRLHAVPRLGFSLLRT